MNVKHLVYPILILTAASLASCAGNPEHTNARSVHVDSTNVNGSAPVQYGADNPADTTPKLPESDDTGRRANTEQR